MNVLMTIAAPNSYAVFHDEKGFTHQLIIAWVMNEEGQVKPLIQDGRQISMANDFEAYVGTVVDGHYSMCNHHGFHPNLANKVCNMDRGLEIISTDESWFKKEVVSE